MSDNTTFRSASEPTTESAPVPQPDAPRDQALSGESEREPIEIREEGGGSVVLDALNITDKLMVLPEADKAKVGEVKEYVLKVMESKGLGPTVGAFKRVLDDIKTDMGLDKEAEPSIVLDRISGVVRAWRDLSFISDPAEKKSIFMKLANMKTSTEMNREVFRLMSQHKVWR